MKRILCFFVGTAMLGTTVCAKIDETTIMSDATFTYKAQVMPDAKTSITVLKPMKTMEDFSAAEDKLSVLVGYREAKADADGNFEVDFNFGGESGEYEAYLGVEGVAEVQHKKLHYVNSVKNEDAIADLKEALKQGDGAVKTVIAESCSDLGMDTSLISLADDDDIQDAAELLFGEVKESDLSDSAVTSAYLDKALAISLLNSGEIEAFGEYQDIFVTDEGLKAWCEKSFIDEATKKYMNSKMSKSLDSFEELDKALVEAVALGVIRDADGYGSITSYFKEYADELDIETKYVTNAFAKSIIGDEFDSIEDTDMEDFKSDSSTSGNSSGSGGRGGNGGSLGGISVQGGTVAPATPLPKAETAVQTSDFKDLKGYEWAEEAINGLFAAGIVNGRAAGIYAPGEPVLREEFVKMVLEAGKFNEVFGTISFSDVPESAWFYEYIRNAHACGIINGISETHFGSGYEITRQDMAVVCYNMLTSKGVVTAESVVNTKELTFADKDKIADYAVSATEYLYSTGVLTGDENNMFNPDASLTRAEAAAVIYRAYRLIEKSGL